MYVPEDPPGACPVCGRPYDSVSRHAGGLLVNLRENDRYRRVCATPVADGGDPAIDFFHHTHAQSGTSAGGGTDADQDPAAEETPG